MLEKNYMKEWRQSDVARVSYEIVKSRSLAFKRRKHCLSCYSSDYIDGFSNLYDFNNYVLSSIKHVFILELLTLRKILKIPPLKLEVFLHDI